MSRTDSYRLEGRVRRMRGQGTLSGLRIEVWDKGRNGEDIIAAVLTDQRGAFVVIFPEERLRRLGLTSAPRVFLKVFEDERLIYSGEDRRIAWLRPGTTRVRVALPPGPALDPAAIFHVTVAHAVPVLDGPGGQRIAETARGERLALLSVQADGYRVWLDGQRAGWVDARSLDILAQLLREHLADAGERQVFAEDAAAVLHSFQSSESVARRIDCLLQNAALLNGLGRLADGGSRHDADAINRFDAMLDLLIARFQPSPRPPTFTLLALRHEVDQASARLDIPDLNRSYRLPCLLDLGILHRIGSSIFRAAWRASPDDPALVNDRLWAGMHVLGRLISETNFAAAAFYEISRGRAEMVEPLLCSAACDGAAVGGMTLMVQSSLPPGWEPGRFPGLPRLPRFDCRAEQWERTIRAVRCCGQTYRIDEISGSRCPGGVLTIEGEGFSHVRPTLNDDGEEEYPPGVDPRVWPFPFRPDPAPANQVLFPDGEGGYIAATEYPEWLYDRVQVVIPEGAASGVLEMRVLCLRTFLGEPTDSTLCGIEARLPAHDPARAFWKLDVGTLRIEARDWTGAHVASASLPGPDATPLLIAADGCTEVELILSGSDLKEIRLAFRDGTAITFPAGAPGPVRDIAPASARVNDVDGEDQFVVVTAIDGCNNELTTILRLARTPAIRLEVSPGPHDTGSVTAIPVSVRLSCHPDALDSRRDDLPVNLRLDLFDGRPGGLALANTSLNFIDRGPLTTQIDVASPFVSHGAWEVRAREQRTLSPPPPRHVEGIAGFRVATPAFAGTFTGSGTLDIRAPAGRRLPDELSPPPPYGTGATPLTVPLAFDAFGTPDRPNSRVTLARTRTPLDFGGSFSVDLIDNGPGTLHCLDFQLAIPVTVEIGAAGDTVRLSVEATTETVEPALFGRTTGSRIDGVGALRLVAAGTITGGGIALGSFNGLEMLIVLDGRIA